MTTMNEYKFTAEIARHARDVTAAADLWRSAPAALAERTYGAVRVHTDWTPLASGDDIVRSDVHVSGDLAPRDVPAFVELFFHDAFLLFNIAVPGSFGGVITVTGGEYRVNDIAFDASAFACGMTTSVPLADVVAWYPAETNQIASTPVQRVLFHLLHIGRGDHDEWTLRVRLNDCLKALGLDEPLPEVPIAHPMHDESLDTNLDDSAMEIVDRAMARVLSAIQGAALSRGLSTVR
jgi:hypothetical protein